jgi:hypothetical protein
VSIKRARTIHPCPIFKSARLNPIFTLTLVLLAGLVHARQTATAPTSTVDVRTYGAKGDGTTDDAPSIQAAVDACPAGGVVLLPKGRWLLRANAVKLHSGITLRGVGPGSIVIKGRDLENSIMASEASALVIENLKLVVEPTTRAVEVGRLGVFVHCSDVTLRKCVLDGTAAGGLPSQFSLCQFVVCNNVKCLDNQFKNAAGSATGATGASDDPKWGRGSEFAGNVIDDYCDTGIGLWTGARDAHIHNNRLRGRAIKFSSFPVGIDVDGGTQSLIENNDIAGGQIAIRLYDTHKGVYPIEGLMVQGNFLHDQLNYDDQHPAWAIKPENPKSRLDATFVKNRIDEPAPNSLCFMGGGTGHTVLHVDQNEFSGGTFWVFGAYAKGALEVFSGGAPVDWQTSVGNNTVRKPESL